MSWFCSQATRASTSKKSKRSVSRTVSVQLHTRDAPAEAGLDIAGPETLATDRKASSQRVRLRPIPSAVRSKMSQAPKGNPVEDERQKGTRRRPSRRALLTTGAAIGGSAIAGSVASLAYSRRDPDAPSTPAAPSPTTTSTNPWTTRDDRFLATLQESTKSLSLVKEFKGAFPSLKIRDVLPLSGLGNVNAPWTAATIIGPSNQLQITRSGEPSPHYLLDIPAETPAEILSMAWDSTSRTLYLSAGGKLWAWRHAAPETIEQLADVRGATALYEILIDTQGLVWGGTFPLGAVFTFDPATKAVRISSKLASDSEYVRRLTMDARGQLWAGTGARNPRIFMFPRTATGSRIEIQLPETLESGFITAIRAGSSKVRVTTDGHPEVFELDTRSRTWTRKFNATGWVRTPSSTILRNDTFYMVQGGELTAYRDTTATIAALDTAEGATMHLADSGALLSALTPDGFTLSPVPTASKQVGHAADVKLQPGTFKVQSILAPADGNVYVGGFMGTGLAGIDPDSDARWHSPDDLEIVHQIENMISIGTDRLYLGTYSWADVISCDISDRDDSARYKQIARFSRRYHQSRPFGLAANSNSLFVGTVPNYGRSGGILSKIDASSNSTEWVLDGGGEGFINGHSIVGLVADDEYVYGTTSVRNGSGLADTDGPAQVFMLDIAAKKKIWQTAPVPNAGALYTPKLIAGWLLAADLEGINIIDPRTGRLEARHIISKVLNSSQRPGWASASLDIIREGRQIAHCAGGTVSIVEFLSATSSRVVAGDADGELGSRIAASPTGRLFTARGTDVVEIGL